MSDQIVKYAPAQIDPKKHEKAKIGAFAKWNVEQRPNTFFP